MDNRGFTIIEMTIVVFMLTTAILGIGASATYMIQVASIARVRSEALQAIEGRISQIVMDPRYDKLEFLYGSTETDLPGLEGYDRETQITQVRSPGTAGRFTDYKIVMVSVSGPGLDEGMSRTIIVGSP